MYILILIWLISLIVVGFLAYHYRTTIDNFNTVKEIVLERKKKEDAKEAQSVIVDPDDIELMTKIQHEEMLKKLNP